MDLLFRTVSLGGHIRVIAERRRSGDRQAWQSRATCSAFACEDAHAAILNMPADHPMIALDLAVAGNTVLVAPGTYLGAGNQDPSFRTKYIVLRSSGGRDVTVNCESLVRGITFMSESRAAVLEGFMSCKAPKLACSQRPHW